MTKSKTYSFPTFYACYLLKSVQTLRSYRNYIGSTRDPVRRLRQHNGILVQGARETAAHRPWVMQLLVHGFPSRPAATSFEYAWQNPHKSRYLRDDAGNPLFQRRGSRLEQNIMVLQRMIRTHPFSTWPLHVKLFTEEAVRCWDALTSVSPSFSSSVLPRSDTSDGENCAFGNEFTKQYEQLQTQRQRYGSLFPPGFTCSVELEGVDGSSGLQGAGREGTLCITDEHFTSPYLAKNTALIAAGHPLKCPICDSLIHDFASNHLGITLCTHTGCTSVSHLTCLAKQWLETERRLTSPHSPPLESSRASVSVLASTSTSSLHPLHLPASSPASSTLPSGLPSSPAPITLPTSSPSVAPKRTANHASTLIPASAFVTSNPFNLGKGMLPRGGACPSCGRYTLWGDIVKGCYRRHTGRVLTGSEVEEDDEEVEREKEVLSFSDSEELDLSEDSDSEGDELTKRLESLMLEGDTPRRSRKAKEKGKVSGTSPTARKPGRPRKTEPKLESGPTIARGRGRPRNQEPMDGAIVVSTPQLVPLESISTNAPRRRGRPRKISPVLLTSPAVGASEPQLVPPESIPTNEPRRRGRPRKLSPVLLTLPATGSPEPESRLVPPELISTNAPRRRGRPRKLSSALSNSPTIDSPEPEPQLVPSELISMNAPRRRGRPRKLSSALSNSPTIDSPEPEPQLVPSELISTNAPRRRGRPRKLSPVLLTSPAIDLPEPEPQLAPPESISTIAPRRPGRPRRISPALVTSPAIDLLESNIASATTISPTTGKEDMGHWPEKMTTECTLTTRRGTEDEMTITVSTPPN